jgi:hypothetical protein
MRREEIVAALRRLHIVDALRELGARDDARARPDGAAPPAGGGAESEGHAPAPSRVGVVLAALRRHPDRVVAALMAAGVVAMILHWR